MGIKKQDIKIKGWVGFRENRPLVLPMWADKDGVKVLEFFSTKRDAGKRYKDARPVTLTFAIDVAFPTLRGLVPEPSLYDAACEHPKRSTFAPLVEKLKRLEPGKALEVQTNSSASSIGKTLARLGCRVHVSARAGKGCYRVWPWRSGDVAIGGRPPDSICPLCHEAKYGKGCSCPKVSPSQKRSKEIEE